MNNNWRIPENSRNKKFQKFQEFKILTSQAMKDSIWKQVMKDSSKEIFKYSKI